jgi:hypothetical protein
MQAHQYAMGSQTPDVVGRTCDTEKIVPDIGIDDSEMSYRRGYQHGAAETFRAVEHFLGPATREVLRAWIEQDIHGWRVKAMLGYPPIWRLSDICAKWRPLQKFSRTSQGLGTATSDGKRMRRRSSRPGRRCRRLVFDSMSKQFRLSYASRVAVVVETSHGLA